MPDNALLAAVFSADRTLLRRLSRLLESIGCRVESLATEKGGDWLVAASRPDLVILDSDLSAEVLASICGTAIHDVDAGPPPVILALVANHDLTTINAMLAAGADDILHKPLIVGEVLARLRGAARLREQQWRRHLQLGNSEILGFLPGPAWHALAAEVARQRTGMGACVAIKIDHFEQLAGGHGSVRIADLRAAIVDRLQAAGGEGVVWGQLHGDCLAALLTSSDEVAALTWAEGLRAALVVKPFELDGVFVPITASMGVAPLGNDVQIAEEQARGALKLAQCSGRDCVVSAQEWQNECRRLNDEPSWLDSANAWDIMFPHSLALFAEDTVEQAALLMAQTQLAHIPVVDAAGQLLGLISTSSLHLSERKTSTKASSSRSSHSVRFVRGIMQGKPTQFSEETPVRKLQLHFASDPNGVAVITRQGRPLGLVYGHTLASLEERLTRRTFAASGPFTLDSAYLTTPETYTVEV